MENKPFLLSPAGKDYLWGGSRLNEEFEKNIDMYPLAETWECSTHPEGLSIVASGSHIGKTLAEVLKEFPQYLGSHPAGQGELPILIKFIDANQDLSVQVHPDDSYARVNEDGQHGKSEMWYVLDSKSNASLIYGLKRDLTRDELRLNLKNGDIEQCLQRISVSKDDVFFVQAGTIHAIGAGALIVEIQENSNLTYRLYDYNRVDKNGRNRELHIDKALDVAELKAAMKPRQPMRVLRYYPGMARELLCRCKSFEVYRMIINTERRQKVFFKADEMSFRVLLCVDGCGTLVFEEDCIHFYKGDCIFVPANSVDIMIHGQASFLDVRG